MKENSSQSNEFDEFSQDDFSSEVKEDKSLKKERKCEKPIEKPAESKESYTKVKKVIY